MFPLKNVVLPAVLVASSVFSALTFPFTVMNANRPLMVELPMLSNPLLIEMPPFVKGEGQPFLKSDNRDLTIRYIGGSLVMSVGAGLVTVELLRRLHASRRLKPSMANSLQLISSSDLAMQEADSSDWFAEAAAFNMDAFNGVEMMPSSPAPVALQLVGGTATGVATEAVATEAIATEAITTDTVELLPCPWITNEQSYEICRVRVPNRSQRLFAILWQGEFYSYFKTLETEEQALEVVKKLSRRDNRAVVTPTDRGYEVWLWQPEAFLDLVS